MNPTPPLPPTPQPLNANPNPQPLKPTPQPHNPPTPTPQPPLQARDKARKDVDKVRKVREPLLKKLAEDPSFLEKMQAEVAVLTAQLAAL